MPDRFVSSWERGRHTVFAASSPSAAMAARKSELAQAMNTYR